MNRTLLLLPVLAVLLMACPQKHATTSAPPAPAAPDPNAYNTAPPQGSQQVNVTTTPNEASEVVVAPGTSGSSNNSTTTTTTTATVTPTHGSSTTPTTDTATHVVGKPDVPVAVENNEEQGKGEATRLVVSFISKGGGIDLTAKANFDKFLAKNADVKYTVNPWGREGELDYCFDLKERRAESQAAFVKEVRNFFGRNENVLVKENVVCKHQHAAAPGAVVADSAKLERLVVSFISIGAGTDATAKANLDKWLAKHTDVKYHVVHWGREGEMDYVLHIMSKTRADQSVVVNDVKTLIGTNERVLVQEWVTPHAARPEDVPPPAPEVVDSNVVRLVVSFTSHGGGIDYKAKESFDKWLGERNATWETTNWGREGETNYCFRLSNMNSREQDIFVRDVRTFFNGNERVLVEEWGKCDRRK